MIFHEQGEYSLINCPASAPFFRKCAGFPIKVDYPVISGAIGEIKGIVILGSHPAEFSRKPLFRSQEFELALSRRQINLAHANADHLADMEAGIPGHRLTARLAPGSGRRGRQLFPG